jgi:D-aminoacyl-tRNA deacylase
MLVAMRFIVVSKQCIAAMNIKKKLLQLGDWKDTGKVFDGEQILEGGRKSGPGNCYVMVTIRDYHIYAEGVDQRILKELGMQPELIIFPSKHRSESGKKSLTVHPMGNFGRAEVGGQDRTVSPAAPNLMTEALRQLKEYGKELDYSISFEVTHHGPLLETPGFFIEIGSDEECWNDESAAEVIAGSLLTLEPKTYPVAVGIGGGHYAPRFSDAAFKKKIAFGHMLPNYALGLADEDIVEKIVNASPGLELVCIHKRKELEAREDKLVERFSRHNVKRILFDELEDLS